MQQGPHRRGQLRQPEQGGQVLQHGAAAALAVLFAGDEHFQTVVPDGLALAQVLGDLPGRDVGELHQGGHHGDGHGVALHQPEDMSEGVVVRVRQPPGAVPQDVQQHLLFQRLDLTEAPARHRGQIFARGQQDTAGQRTQMPIKLLFYAVLTATGQLCPRQIVIVKVVDE